MRIFLSSVVPFLAVVTLTACQPSVPDSGQGVGFDRLDAERRERAERDARLEAAPNVQTTTLDDASAEAQARSNAQAANSGQTPLEASPNNPPPQAVTNSAGISRENDFAAVSGERSIESDAERLRRAQSQYTVIEPKDLPTRAGSNRPNIVAYALQTNNPVGTAIYKRSSFNSDAKHQRNCAAYASPDLAQEDFLAMGGPKKDRKSLDPDGDGFACSWDPTPFRRVAGN